MAMTTCKECKKEVSDTAKTCPHCGAKLKMGMFAKVLLTVAVLVVAFLTFGALIPKNVADANAARRVCEKEMMPKGLATQFECDRMYVDIKENRSR